MCFGGVELPRRSVRAVLKAVCRAQSQAGDRLPVDPLRVRKGKTFIQIKCFSDQNKKVPSSKFCFIMACF